MNAIFLVDKLKVWDFNIFKNRFFAITKVESWFSHNGLALNPDKSDAVLFETRQAAQSLGSITSVDVAGTPVALSPTRSSFSVLLSIAV